MTIKVVDRTGPTPVTRDLTDEEFDKIVDGHHLTEEERDAMERAFWASVQDLGEIPPDFVDDADLIEASPFPPNLIERVKSLVDAGIDVDLNQPLDPKDE